MGAAKTLFSRAYSMMAAGPRTESMLENGPESTRVPATVDASSIDASVSTVSGGMTTGLIGRSIFPGKLEIALVVCRYRHDGAGAVFHQYEVGHINRHFFTVKRVAAIAAGERYLFFPALRAGSGAVFPE